MEPLEKISEENLNLLPVKIELCKGCYQPLNGISDKGYHPKTEEDYVGCRRFYLQED